MEGSTGKERNEIEKSKTEYLCLNGTSKGSVKMLSNQLPEVKEFKFLGNVIAK